MRTDIDMTKRHTPQSVAIDNLAFSIPLYQRLFTWRKKQVNGLMYDLWNHFLHQPNKPYFIGMLSCFENSRTNRLDLIDGQQRFTVAMLMGVVLRRYDNRWDSFIDNSNRLYFTARESDNDCLRSLIAKTRGDLGPDNRMVEAVLAIQQFLNDKQRFPSSDEQCLFSSSVFEKMSFFISVLPSSYANNPSSLNEYFEAMNAGGKGLEQHEILKVELLRGETDQKELTRIWNAVCDMDRPVIRQNEGVNEKKYRETYLEAIRLCRGGNCSSVLNSCVFPDDASDMTSIGNIQPIPVLLERDLRRTDDTSYRCIVTFPDFLMMVFDIYHNLNGGYSYYRQDLLSTYGDKTHAIHDKFDFFTQLFLYRLLFDFYVIHREGIDNSEGYNLILQADNARDFYSRALIQFQSMLYVSQAPLYTWLRPMLKTLHDKGDLSPCELLKMLKSLDDEQVSHIPPDMLSTLSYRNGIDRYWFWKLDYLLWERHEREDGRKDEIFADCSELDHHAISYYVFRRDRSIEHLHPQHPLPESESQDWEEDRRAHNDEVRDGFGNLAMISLSFNSTQSRDSISTKIGRIEDQVRERRLQSIKLLLMIRAVKSNPNGWTVVAAKTHEAKMLTVLQKKDNTKESK